MNIVDLTSAVPATNYTVGRRSLISQISEHHVVGDASHAINKAKINGQEFSCTYTIGSNGTIYRLVAENNTPYTDNDFDSNSRSITIEHAGGGDYQYTEAMYRASIELHAQLFQKYGNLVCVRHKDIPEIKADPRKATECPGGLSVERIVSNAKALQGEEMLRAPHQASLFVAYLGRLPLPEEVARDVGRKTVEQMVNELDQSGEYADKKKRDAAAYSSAASSDIVAVTEQLYRKKK